MTDQLAVTQRKIAVARQVASEARIMFLISITFIKPQFKLYLGSCHLGLMKAATRAETRRPHMKPPL